MENKEIYKKLANQIYELDEKVYKASGSNLGKTFTGEKVRIIEDLTMLIASNPQGHLLRSEMALIGNMARSIRDKQVRRELLIEYNSKVNLTAITEKNDVYIKHFADCLLGIKNYKYIVCNDDPKLAAELIKTIILRHMELEENK